jgi:hypothetical protein
VLYILHGVGVGLDLDSCCSSDCCMVSCSFGLSLGCSCSCHLYGSPSCITPGCCETSRPLSSCHGFLPQSSYLSFWGGSALHNFAFSSTVTVKSVMPIRDSRFSLWLSLHFVSLACSHPSGQAIGFCNAPCVLLDFWLSC